MAGAVLVRQKVASVARWNPVFRDPELDEVRRRHGLVVTGTYIDADHPDAVIAVMGMADIGQARESASSAELATARERASVIGAPGGVWCGPEETR